MSDPDNHFIEKHVNEVSQHFLNIPINVLPLVGEADFGLAIKPVVHRDRTAKFNVLIYILKGRMDIIEDGAAYELTPGTLFFLKSGVHHWGEKQFEIGTAWYYVHFYYDEPLKDMTPFTSQPTPSVRLSSFPENYHQFVTVPKILKLPLENELEKQLAKLIQLFQSAELVRSSLAVWDILLLSMELGNKKAEKSRDDRRMEAVVSFLEHHFCRAITSSELEKEIGFTYKHIGTLFKKKTGKTIKEYQTVLRIEKAVKLLCESEMSLSEIAGETGFYDSFYFSKIFKRAKGISPQKFRDTHVPRM